MFEEDTDKKMSVKQLKAELVELGYVVKKGDYGFVLKNWKEKMEVKDIIIENNQCITDEEFEYVEE